MIIENKILKYIYKDTQNSTFESGGILGSDNKIINYYSFDKGIYVAHCSYSPNVDYLNNTISDWQKHSIRFLGIFHTHFFGVDTLSDGDMFYINNILFSMPNEIEYLYFPIVLPEFQEIIPYIATRQKNKISIDIDELVVI